MTTYDLFDWFPAVVVVIVVVVVVLEVGPVDSLKFLLQRSMENGVLPKLRKKEIILDLLSVHDLHPKTNQTLLCRANSCIRNAPQKIIHPKLYGIWRYTLEEQIHTKIDF